MIAVMLAMFTVKNDPSYLWIALVLLATGAVFQEFAVVSYNAMLPQVSTPETIGRVSGFGWAMGYFGGIFLLLICYVGFIAPDVGWFGVTSAGGLNIRAVVVFSAIWFAVFAIPVLMAVPESPPGPKRRRVSFFASYRLLVNDIKALFKRDRNSVYFLIASALYRDGLAAIFSFGAILAVSVYGLAQSTVLIFGIAANVVAALGALGMGAVEDRIGPKKVIMISLDRADQHVDDPALCPRHHSVLDFRADLDAVGGSRSVQLSGVHGTHRAGRAGRRNVRTVRHHRSRRLIPGASTFRPLLRFVHRPRRYRGHRSRAAGRRNCDGRREVATKTTGPGLRIELCSRPVGIEVRNISAWPRVEPVGLEKRQATVDGGCAHG